MPRLALAALMVSLIAGVDVSCTEELATAVKSEGGGNVVLHGVIGPRGALKWAAGDWTVMGEATLIDAEWTFESSSTAVILLRFEGSVRRAMTSRNGSLWVDRCRFGRNSGGAIHVVLGTATIRNTIFEDNGDTERGGGALIEGVASIVTSIFRRNAAREGGAIWFSSSRGGELVVYNSSFVRNRAIRGGAASCYSTGSLLTIENSSFVQNEAIAPRMSGLPAMGGALHVGGNLSAKVAHSAFRDNRAWPESPTASGGCLSGQGGAIAALGVASLKCWSSRFEANRAVSGPSSSGAQGGAVYLAYSRRDVTFKDCLFAKNVASGRSANMAVETGGGAAGGGLSIAYSLPSFEHCRFEANLATGGPNDPSRGGAARLVDADSNFADCIFLGNQAIGYASSSSYFSSGAFGGAVAIEASTPVFRSTAFYDNQAVAEQRADAHDLIVALQRGNRVLSLLSSVGGAVHATSASAPTFEECTFDNNEAELSGHDIAATGGIYSPYTSLVNATTAVGLFNCSFAGLHKHTYQRQWRRLLLEEKILDTTRFDSRFVESAAEAVARARVVALGATVDVDGPIADEALANLQVVVIGDADWSALWQSFDTIEAYLDAMAIWQLGFQDLTAPESVHVPFPAGVRAASGAFSHNSTSLSVLALWADVVLGVPNQIGRGRLSELILVGGHLLLRSNTTTVHNSIVLDDAGILGMDRRTPAVLRLTGGGLGLYSSYSPSIVGRVFDRFTDGMTPTNDISRLPHRRGKLVLYGATIDFADGELRLDDAHLDIKAGARWILRKSTLLTLAGNSEVLSDHATVVICNGTVRRTLATSDLSLRNATFLHNGVLSYDAQNVRSILQPPLDAWRVLPGQLAMVNATLDPEIQVSYSSRWLIYRQHNHSAHTAAQTAIAGAGNGIGLRLEDGVDQENHAVLEAHVDYVDCEARVVGRLLPDDDKTDSNGKGSNVDYVDRESLCGLNASNAAAKAVIGVREQCALCLGNSSCGFSHTAARDADRRRENSGLVYIADIPVCVIGTGKSSGSSVQYSYRSANCCEDGCSAGGSCVKGRCRCTWWWSGSRCSALSSKARMFIMLCASALLAVGGVVACIVLWKRRKSRAIGQVLDELRQNLLDVDVYDDVASDLTPAVHIPAEEVHTSPELTNHDRDDIWRSWSPAMSASMLTTDPAANDDDDAARTSPRHASRRNGDHLALRRSRSMSALFEAKTATQCSTLFDYERQREGLKCVSGQGRAQPRANLIRHFGSNREHGDDAGVHRGRQPRSSSLGLFSFGTKKCSDGPAINAHNRAAGNSETHRLFNADYVRDLRQRLILRDVLIRREELNMHDRIGSGAFGDVFRATYRGCDVAVKKLKIANFVHDDATLIEEVDRFRSEAILMARLRHPNVLMILGVVVDNDDESRAYFASLSRGPSFRSQEARHSYAISNDAGHPKRRRSTARHDLPSIAPPPLLALSIVTEFLALQALADLLYDEATYNPALPFQMGPPRAMPLPPEAWSYELVLLCAIQAARGMLYLHLRNPPICHRDLKCANLMVDEHWRVKIGDYGLSRFVYHRSSRLADEVPPDAPVDEALAVNVAKSHEHFMTADLGTLRWRAPETFGRGRRRVSYSTKADVYSFGCCLLELYNRKPPWAHLSSRFDITDAILAGELQTLEPPAPPAFTALLNTCMALDPAVRPNFARIVSDLDAELRRARADARGSPDHPSLRTLALANGNGLPRLSDSGEGRGGFNTPNTSVDFSTASSHISGADTV